MGRLWQVSARLFVNNIHKRCGITDLRPTVGEGFITERTWNSLFQSSEDSVLSSFPIKITAIDGSIRENFSGWNSGSFLIPGGNLHVRSAPNFSDEPITYGNSQSRGYMQDVYEDFRSVCSTEEFVSFLEGGSQTSKSLYLAGVSLSSVCKPVPSFPVPSQLARLLLPNAPLIYMGKGNQRTPLHFDPTGNLVLVVRGRKTFDLFPPSSSHLLNPIGGLVEAFLSWYGGWVPAVYSRYRGDESQLEEIPGRIRVHLEAGEGLWMPPCWWHGVSGGQDPNVILVFGTRPV